MSATTVEERPRPHPAVETAFLAPEAVLFDSRHHQVHHLNPSASAVWLCIDGELTADQIATELSEIFDTPRELIRPDVDEAIGEFVRLGLLDGSESPGDEHTPDHHDHDDHDHDDDHHHPHHHGHHHHDHGHHDHHEPSGDAGVVVLPRPPDP